MSKITIYKSVTFSAAHRLYNQSLSEEENGRLYGKCTGQHGHNYRLVIGLKGSIDQGTGMVVNLSEVKSELERGLLEQLDHHNVNDISFFQEHVPTLEMLAVWIWDQLLLCLPDGLLHEIVIYESDNTFARYFGGL